MNTVEIENILKAAQAEKEEKLAQRKKTKARSHKKAFDHTPSIDNSTPTKRPKLTTSTIGD